MKVVDGTHSLMEGIPVLPADQFCLPFQLMAYSLKATMRDSLALSLVPPRVSDLLICTVYIPYENFGEGFHWEKELLEVFVGHIFTVISLILSKHL